MPDPDVLARLSEVRSTFANELRSALEVDPLVGVTGEAGVGKSSLLRHVIETMSDANVVYLDLALPTSTRELGRQWTLQLARPFVSEEQFVEMAFRDPDTWPLSTHRELVQFAETAGDLTRHLTRQMPHASEPLGKILPELMRASENAARSYPMLLVFDHLEAPSLAFRHPIDVQEVLWGMRSVLQLGGSLRALLCCRPPAVSLASGEPAAFYGEGRWIRAAWPTATEFAAATDRPVTLVRDVLRYTRGHVTTTLDVLERCSDYSSVVDVALQVAATRTELAQRSLDYARSLHRLGGRLLQATAWRQGPYRSAPEENPNAIASAMRRLHLAGLVSKPVDEWMVTDPSLAWALTGDPTLERRRP